MSKLLFSTIWVVIWLKNINFLTNVVVRDSLLFPTWLVMTTNCTSTSFFLAILVGTNDKTLPNDNHRIKPPPSTHTPPIRCSDNTSLKWAVHFSEVIPRTCYRSIVMVVESLPPNIVSQSLYRFKYRHTPFIICNIQKLFQVEENPLKDNLKFVK